MVNWSECAEIETIPGKMGGRPVIKGTRIEPETVATDHALGATDDEIHESFPTLTLDVIHRIIAFAQHQELVA
jgi:uncharacterized protein (DUF433 family)